MARPGETSSSTSRTHSHLIRTDILRADSRGDEPPDVTSKGSCLAPLASLTENGTLVWNDELKQKILALATPPRRHD